MSKNIIIAFLKKVDLLTASPCDSHGYASAYSLKMLF